MSNGASPIDSTLLSAIIAAFVAICILFVDRVFIEPRTWKKRYEIRSLEKALETHGWLISILASCHAKVQMLIKEGIKQVSADYYVDTNDIRKLELIFEKKAYLLSDRLKELWIELHTTVPQFAELKLGTILILYLPLKSIQDQAEKDFSEYQELYKKLTRFRPLRR